MMAETRLWVGRGSGRAGLAGVAAVLAIVLSPGAVTAFAADAPAEAVTDPMLQAMRSELDRERAGLVLPGMQRPYFIEYRMDDLASYEALANYGALTREESGHQRVVRVTVRIGSYASDNSGTRGDGNVQLAPEDNDPEALKYALWLATDEAYKGALRAYTAKQAALKQFEGQRKEQDFAAAKAVTHIEPVRTLDFDDRTRAEWRRRLVEGSGLYATDPEVRGFSQDVQYSTANLRAVAMNRYLVNTEGTTLRTGYTGYQANISVGGQAPDGMRVGRDNGSTAATVAELESWTAFRARIVADLKSFHALTEAPVVAADDYHGPVLFSGDASADVLNRLFVPNVEADRPDPGTTARTQGTYTSSLHTRILPELLSATDDPTRASFDGRRLLGSYQVDDEGVPAEMVDVVKAGKLSSYLIGREPVRDFPESNGHGRAGPGQAAHSHSGVMVFEPVPGTDGHALSDAAMTDRLLALAREQKRDVYAVDTLGGELSPRVLYRVHPDGRRELVRGAAFDELDNRSLRSSVVAAGGTPYLANTLGAIPQTTIAPELLFDDIVVKRASEEQQKLPYYAPPPAAGAR